MQIFIGILIVFTVVCLVVVARAIYRRDFAKDAKVWLEVLRKGHSNPEFVLSHFWDKLRRSTYSLEQIGTSEEELSDLTAKSHTLAIADALARLRNDPTPTDADATIGRIRKLINKWGLTLNEVGTDENELNELARKGRRVQLLNLVERLHEISSQKNILLGEMCKLHRQIENNGEFTLEELGTSEEELKRIASIA
jgi:hypothetical protein